MEKTAVTNPIILISYDYRLVALSILISILASYAVLDLAGRVSAARGSVRLAWLPGGVCAMGAAHFSPSGATPDLRHAVTISSPGTPSDKPWARSNRKRKPH